MPTKRRRRAAKHRGWTGEHLWQLQTGCNHLATAPGEESGWGPHQFSGPYSTEQIEDMERCWQVHGEELTHRRIGCRPWYWWFRKGFPKRPDNEVERLRAMGELSTAEEKKVREWERCRGITDEE